MATKYNTDPSGTVMNKRPGWNIPAVPSPVKEANKSTAKSSGSQYAGKKLTGLINVTPKR